MISYSMILNYFFNHKSSPKYFAILKCCLSSTQTVVWVCIIMFQLHYVDAMEA